MTGYEERTWLRLYGDKPADYEVEYTDALAMFPSSLASRPGQPAVKYF